MAFTVPASAARSCELKFALFMYSFTERTPIYLALLVIVMTAISTAIPLFKILSKQNFKTEKDKSAQAYEN